MQPRRAIFCKHSRSASLWAIALFVVGQLVAGLLLDYVFPLTRFPSAAKALERADKDPDPTVAFFGSSRTESAIVTAEADRILAAECGRQPPPRVLNAYIVAGDSLSSEFVFTRLLDRGMKPEWIVLEVSPEMVDDKPPFMREHAVRQLTWPDLFTTLPTIVRANATWVYVEGRVVPIYSHRRQIVLSGKSVIRDLLPAPGPAAPVAVPGAGMPGRPADTSDPGLAMKPAFTAPAADANSDELLKQSKYGAEEVVRRWLKDYRVGGPTPAALERILARCRTHGIRVILLGIPACSFHRKEITPDVEAAYTGYVNRLTAEYGCRFVDCRDWVPDLMFGDTLHLRSETGGMLFTDRFTREILLPVLRR
jgi:hypothetical protein